MMIHRVFGACCVVFVCLLGWGGCSDEGDCVSLCDDAQSKNCTFITGDCDAFCGALLDVEADAGCQTERESYQDCLNDQDDVCVGCEATESALTNCLEVFCAANPSRAECVTLVGATT